MISTTHTVLFCEGPLTVAQLQKAVMQAGWDRVNCRKIILVDERLAPEVAALLGWDPAEPQLVPPLWKFQDLTVLMTSRIECRVMVINESEGKIVCLK